MTKTERVNIIDLLTTPGCYVYTPNGGLACIRSFNATTNEVEVAFGSVGFMESLARGIGRHAAAAFENDMRERGVWGTYHFTKLRIAPDPSVTP